MEKDNREPTIIISTKDLKAGSPNSVPNPFAEQVAAVAEMARRVTQIHMPTITKGINGIMESTGLIDQMMAAQKNALEAVTKIINTSALDGLQRIAQEAASFAKRLQSHFPVNWPEDKTAECAKLCMLGVPIVLIPRTKIVSRMVATKNMAGIKMVAIRNDKEIVQDCENAIEECTWLSKDMRLQITEGIDCYKTGKYRAAQSTINVAFDSILDEIIDFRKWRRSNNKPGKLSHSMVRKLTNEFSGDIMELPLSRAPFYTLLMFPIIGSALSTFEIGDTATHSNGYNRHATTHTVSSKQYKRSNAIFAIMAVASICRITELRGKNWMQLSAREYGVTLSSPSKSSQRT